MMHGSTQEARSLCMVSVPHGQRRTAGMAHELLTAMREEAAVIKRVFPNALKVSTR